MNLYFKKKNIANLEIHSQSNSSNPVRALHEAHAYYTRKVAFYNHFAVK